MRVKKQTYRVIAAIAAVSLQANITLAETCKEKLQDFAKYNDALTETTAKMESLRVSEISEELVRAGNLTMAAMYAVSGSILDNNCLSGSERNEMILINRALRESLDRLR
jgi:hypothetical protein